jgi:hypothetical protein
MMGMDLGGLLVHNHKVAGGFLAAISNERTNKFLAETNEILLDGNFHFDKDQPLLAEMYHKHVAEGLKWFHADRLYLDHLERESSFIWSAHKSERGIKDVRYEKYRKYLQKVRPVV